MDEPSKEALPHHEADTDRVRTTRAVRPFVLVALYATRALRPGP